MDTEKLHENNFTEQGQTLIETMAAVFILIMGVTAALGLAIYANASSTVITKQIIATGLAREGVEAIKNMRDTNWLKQTSIDKNCYNFASSTPSGIGAQPASCPGSAVTASCCYRQWLSGLNCALHTNLNSAGFCIDPGVNVEIPYTLSSEKDNLKKIWILTSPGNTNLYIYATSTWGDSGFNGLYKDSSSAGYNSSGFYRQISLSTLGFNSSGLYNPNAFSGVGPRLEITSRVWWTDKRCPDTATWPGYGKCSIEIKGYLTNWKNY
jgi:Tfp pilus assembly protein PilV